MANELAEVQGSELKRNATEHGLDPQTFPFSREHTALASEDLCKRQLPKGSHRRWEGK